MFDGLKLMDAHGSRLDMEFEFDWFLRTIEVNCPNRWNEVRVSGIRRIQRWRITICGNRY